MDVTNRIFYIVNVDSFFMSHRLSIALAAQKAGFEVFVLAKDTGMGSEITRHGLHFINIDFERSGTNPLKDAKIILKLKKLIRHHQPRIIHNVTIKPAIYGSIAARYARGSTKVINAISGLGYNFIEGRDSSLQKLIKQLIHYAFKPSLNFIFQNQDDCQLYEEQGLLKGNRYKIIKGSGVDGDVYPFRHEQNKGILKVLVTSRMLYDKGIMEFIEAANLLKSKWKGKARFVLVGGVDKGNRACIPEEVIKAHLEPDYIEWVGFKKEVKPFLFESHIVSLLSYREGLPKALIEAMAVGRPIVTTNVPGCKECVEDGVNGFLVPAKKSRKAAECIDRLLSDAELRQQMGAASRRKMEQELSLAKVIKETLDFYEQV